jgi:hypothetical protein
VYHDKRNSEVFRKEAMFWGWTDKNARQMIESCRSSQLAFVDKSKSSRLGDEGEKRHN